MLHSWPLRMCIAALLSLGSHAYAGNETLPEQDLTQVPFEQLLNMEVSSAYKMAYRISDAPSAVAVVTAADIRAYGYRTLADIVNSMRGLYTPFDGSYLYLGGRGFGRAGDYAGRILLMIDGYPTNDNIYSQAYIGNDSLLDTELIERVEYAPGTGSSVYGNNAYFGIINVITKKGRDFSGAQLAGDVASHGNRKGRATFGKQLENGADILLSASMLNSDGQNFFFPEFNNVTNDPNVAVNHGIAKDHDYERSPHVFGKLQYEGLSVEGAYVSRKHGNPTGAYNSVFNSFTQDWDTNGYLSTRYDSDLSQHLKSSVHAYYGYYLDRTVLTSKTNGLLHEHNRGQWWGLDTKFVGNWFDNHKLVFGAEYRDDFELRFLNSFNASNDSHQTFSFYLQDELGLTDKLRMNAGGRYDYVTDIGGNVSPRLALMYSPFEQTLLKASYSMAYRMPAAYEKYYKDDTEITNRALMPEHISTAELVLQQQITQNMRFTGTMYHYQTRQLITNVTLASGATQFINSGSGHTNGLELELEHSWNNGIRLRGSYAHQSAIDPDGRHMVNSPDDLGKFNLSFPLRGLTLPTAVRTGLEVQYTGSRLTETRATANGYTLTNLTFSSEQPWHGWGGSFSIRNLFDTNYVAVAPGGYVQDTLQMDGRNFWLQLTYDFK